MKIVERYASAVRSSNMRSAERTNFSDADVIGAFGLAAKTEPLGVALHRLFAGDNGAALEVIDVLAGMLSKHFPASLKASEAKSVAAGVLDYNRDSVCPACHGRGRELIPGSPTLGDRDCPQCLGTGRKRFAKQFHRGKLKYADWAQQQIDAAAPRAGLAAMKAIAPRLDL